MIWLRRLFFPFFIRRCWRRGHVWRKSYPVGERAHTVCARCGLEMFGR